MSRGKVSAVVLMVDDEVDFLHSASGLLERRGFTVVTARSGEEALAELRRTPVDLVLLDVKMPGMDGEKVFQHLQREHPALPVIMLTGHGTIPQAFQMSKDGVADYVAKPCDMDRLATKMRATIEERRGEEERPPARAPDQAASVLLVDDEEDLLDALKKPLMRRGMEVYTAAGGEQALSLLKAGEVDVVVLDVKMPGMHGLQVLRTIRRDFPNIRVILLSGHASAANAAEGLKIGAMDYLVKPPDIDTLVETIRRGVAEGRQEIESRRQELVRRALDRRPD